VQRQGDADLSTLRTYPEFRAAIEAARASFARGEEFSGEELDMRLGISDEDKAAGEAWLDEYERQLASEQQAPAAGTRQAEQALGGG